MSAPIRFLAVAVAGWVTIRAAASVLPLPALALPAFAPALPTPAPTAQPGGEASLSYAPLPAQAAADGYPAAAAYAMPAGYPGGAAWRGQPYPPAMPYPVPRYMPVPMPAYYPAPPPMPAGRQSAWAAPEFGSINFSGMPEAQEAPMSRMAAVSLPLARAGRAAAMPSFDAPGPPRLDRWSLSSWALMRQERASVPGATSTVPALAAGGQLGGSQGGVRLGYRFNPHLGVNLRFSAPIPAPGAAQSRVNGEAALGVAWQPLSAVPVRLMAERRQRVGGPEGGRNAFAFLAEGGVYDRPLPLGFKLDGYGQSGIVSVRRRDWFVDGAVTASRPLLGRYSAGLGVWGGAQRGLARLDVGPRVSMRLLPGIKAHVDYRWQALGKARPGSGYAVTVAGDF